MKRNLIPIVEIGPVIGELIAERWPYGGGQAVLAEKIGCDESAIWGIVEIERETADFDLVDSLLCGLGRPDLWWGVFNDIYWDADLAHERCAREGCNVIFVPRKGGRNGPDARQMYCGRKCRHMDWKVRKGIVKDGRKRNLETHCRNGHKRTPENQVRRGSYMTCAICVRERKSEWLKRRTPEQIEKSRAYHRDYYERRKLAIA